MSFKRDIMDLRPKNLSIFFKRALDCVFPNALACCACNRETFPDEAGLCPKCANEISRCFDGCNGELGYIDECLSGLVYDGVIVSAMHRFKYNGGAYMAEFFAQYMPIPVRWQATCIVPVPLHPLRLSVRGYNQSRLLADALSKRCDIPVEETLIRVKRTKKQARLKHDLRPANVLDAFRAVCDCKGERIVLVDDVLTTGNTLNQCAKALKESGAHAVFAVSACRATIFV